MTEYGRTIGDVRQWPDDADARRALEEYLAALPADARVVTTVLNGGGLDFTGADLSGLELLEAEFSEANLTGVRLVGADLAGAWLLAASLRNADLSRSSLRKALGRGCDARDAVATEADLRGAEFENANLGRVDFRNALFGNARLPQADLRGADLRGCVFGQGRSWASLTKTRIAGCPLEGAHGSVLGPVDIGEDTPLLLDGADLGRWFAEHGAPGVEVSGAVAR